MNITKTVIAVALLATLAASPVASAQTQGVAGSYDVSVSVVANSCKKAHFRLADKASLSVSTDIKDILLQLPQVPDLRGPLRKRGRFQARGTQRGTGSGYDSGNFSATGRANSGSIRMVLVAEFYKDGRAQCTQSWNIVGTRR